MNLENELKFCLKLDTDLEQKLLEDINTTAHMIHQAYLSSQVRVRKSYDLHSCICEYTMTIKNRRTDGINEEVELNIDESVYEQLLKHTNSSLTKRRYKFDKGECTWDVDFFIVKDDPYFAMAEIEMPEHMEYAPGIPDILKDYVLYEVPRHNSDYSSRKLCDQIYAENLYQQLITQ